MADTDLTASGSSTNIDTLFSAQDAVFLYGSPQNSGTGGYGTFLAIKDNDGSEEGFNSDAVSGQYLNVDEAKTVNVPVSSLEVVNIGGVDYYIFRFDLNEPGSDGSLAQKVGLTQLKFFLSPNPAQLGDFNNTTDTFANTSQTYTKILDLDSGGDRTLVLVDHSSGSGTDDYELRVPVSAFNGVTDGYLTVYANFGPTPPAEGGFEEVSALTTSELPPAINVEKTADPASIGEGSSTEVTFTYAVTNTSPAGPDDPLLLTLLKDDNGTPGNALDDINLLDGFVAGTTYGAYYQTGDDNGNFRIDSDETWIFEATRNVIGGNAGDKYENTVSAQGKDNENISTPVDTDTATVTFTNVDPTVHVEKTASPTSINEGVSSSITYTYAVTNTSDAGAFDPLLLTSFIDDNATPGNTGDDVNLLKNFAFGTWHGDYYTGGDDDGDYLVDSDETWAFSYTRNGVIANAKDGDIVNTVVVQAKDDENTATQDDDTATVTVKNVAPSINLDKTVDGDGNGTFHDFENAQAFGSSVTYKYVLTNTSPAGAYDPLTVTDLVDNNGTTNTTADDVQLVSGGVVKAGVTFSGDANNNGLLDVGESWTYLYTTNINLNPSQTLINTAVVTAFDDEGCKATDDDTATVQAFAGPGVRTPGFWTNLGKQFWDGTTGNETKSGPNFASGELTYLVDHDNSNATAKKAGLLIGDYNKNGCTDAGEDTFYISLTDAAKLIDASQKEQQDTRWVLGRDAVATWLNYLAGNPIDDGSGNPVPNSPHFYLDQAIDWLQTTNGGTNASKFEDWGGGSAVKASAAFWGTAADTESATAGNELAGSTIHEELDYYNNTGMTFLGVNKYIWANDGG